MPRQNPKQSAQQPRSQRGGLDHTFLHYGIREADLEVILDLCDRHCIDRDWLRDEVLKNFHAKKVDAIEISDADVERVLNDALNQLPTSTQ
ncbi:MAG: hypothetical protein LUD17_07835 [Bacteroidales bacterium]|nr:hypothetical protein [Bacteroidales bacterium]